jgi:hypothetical protein
MPISCSAQPSPTRGRVRAVAAGAAPACTATSATALHALAPVPRRPRSGAAVRPPRRRGYRRGRRRSGLLPFRRSSRSKITPWRRRRGRLQCLDAEMRGQRVEDGEAAGDHGAAVFLQAGQVELVDGRPQALLHAPAQAVGRDAPSVTPLAASSCETAPDRARRAERLAPVSCGKRLPALLQAQRRRHLGGAKGVVGEACRRGK